MTMPVSWVPTLFLLSLATSGCYAAKSLKVWIDSDGGIDDAQAILLALGQPNVHLVGISCVRGNVEVPQVIINVRRALAAAAGATATGQLPYPVPVYAGANQPLVLPEEPLTNYYGVDGLGDVPDLYPRVQDVSAVADPGDAVDKLAEAAAAYSGKLHVIGLAPLTNLAHAVHKHPNLASKLASLFVLGGAEGEGNITPAAEFNFYQDPEAAQDVLVGFSGKLRLLTWQTCEHNLLTWQAVDDWAALNNTVARFATGIMAPFEAQWRLDSPQGIVLGDPLAVAAGLASKHVVLSSRNALVRIELKDPDTRGKSIFQFLDANASNAPHGHSKKHQTPKTRGKVSLVGDMDMDYVRGMLLQSYSA